MKELYLRFLEYALDYEDIGRGVCTAVHPFAEKCMANPHDLLGYDIMRQEVLDALHERLPALAHPYQHHQNGTPMFSWPHGDVEVRREWIQNEINYLNSEKWIQNISCCT